jgi:hypothetical protein
MTLVIGHSRRSHWKPAALLQDIDDGFGDDSVSSRRRMISIVRNKQGRTVRRARGQQRQRVDDKES